MGWICTLTPSLQPPMFPWLGEPSMLPPMDEWIRRSELVLDCAHVSLQWAILAQRIQADRWRRPHHNHQPGQRVWLSSHDLKLWLPWRKFSPRYVGPFKQWCQINRYIRSRASCSLLNISFLSCLPYETGPPCIWPWYHGSWTAASIGDWWSTGRPTWWKRSQILGIEGVRCSTWWTGIATDQRRDHG